MTEKVTSRTIFLFVFLAIGLIIGLTNLFAPFHELGHIVEAGKGGSDAKITGWASSEINSPSADSLIAGWTWEVAWAVMIGIICSIVGRVSPKMAWCTGGAGLGYAFVTWIRAFSSSDFNSSMKAYVASRLVDKNSIPQVWAEIHSGLMFRWALVGGIALVICTIIVVRNVVKSIPQKKR